MEYLKPGFLVGNTDLYLPVEPARPAQRRVHRIGSVGGSNDHHLASRLHAVHESQELGHYATLNLSCDLLALRGDRVNLIDEHNARSLLLGCLEELSELLLGLAVILGHDLWAAEGLEVGICLRRQSPRKEGLAGARRAVEENAFRGFHAQPLEELGVLHGELYHLPDLLDLGSKAAYIFVGHPWHGLLFLCRLLADLYPCSVADDHCVLGWVHSHGDKLDLSAHHADLDDVSARQHTPFHVSSKVLFRSGDAHRDRGSKNETFCRCRLNDPDGYAVVYGHVGVPADVAVQTDDSSSCVVRVAGPK
ncbi:Uncharacterised protein [uncultured archaeon]|nr:Uncharacterised protein [uncultured archaeon]